MSYRSCASFGRSLQVQFLLVVLRGMVRFLGISVCAIAGGVWFITGLWPLTLVCVALGNYVWRSRTPIP